MSHTFTVKPSYRELRSLYVSADARKDPHLQLGKVSASLVGDPDFSVDGTMSADGYLSGMAKLYKKLDLKDDAVVEYEFLDDGDVVILSPAAPDVVADPAPADAIPTVFQSQKLKHIYIEPFRPENLNTWEPETEPDIYLAFGVLQDFTDYQYCCGASQSILTKLGAKYDGTSKPDAILIDRITDEYVMAEWKKYSSDYKSNHKPEDVDVLVCWTDNEKDRAVLPRKVLALHSVAKIAAETTLAD